MAMVQQYPALNRPERPACSICVANYNGVDLLGDCLDSIFSQRCDFTLEVIVHDDASPDASVKFLRERYPQVEVLASKENVGFCIGNNRMVAHARGEYILLLNNDAALFPDALATLVKHAGQQSPQGILTLPQHDWRTGELVDRGCLLDPFYNPIPNMDVAQRDIAMVIGACLWIPRALWNELGGLPEWIESIGEDMYLCRAAALRSYPVQTADGSGYRHWQGMTFGGNRVNNGNLQTTIRRRSLSERNKTSVMFIMTPGIGMWPLLAIHLLLLSIEGVVLSVAKLDSALWTRIYWPAISHPVRGLRTLLTQRKQQQAARRCSIHRYFSVFRCWPRKLQLLFRHGIPKIR